MKMARIGMKAKITHSWRIHTWMLYVAPHSAIHLMKTDALLSQDDLAQHAVASPPPYDGDDDFDEEHWRFDYWMDIDYDSDGNEIRQRREDVQALKRKRPTTRAAVNKSPSKRRRVLPVLKRDALKLQQERNLPPIMLLKDRVNSHTGPVPGRLVDPKTLKPYALLPDWIVRFRNTPAFPQKKTTAQLAEVQDIVEDDLDEIADGGSEWMDEDDEEPGAEGAMLDGLDPEALKMALSQNLAALGIDIKGMDTETLLSFASKMISGEAEADDIAGELAEELLKQGEAEEDEDEEADAETGAPTYAFSSWVAREAEARASAREKQGNLTPPKSSGKPSASPPEKTATTNRPPTPAEKGLSADGASEETRGLKRKADRAVDEDQNTKRPARSFDAPTAASKARSSAPPTKPWKKGRKG
jgi:hypothetical protein